ncbi:MAG: hypothetical protein O6948_13500 [Deltaproteobacteria bacterium]|nr:hypothetical protein [Deltaproteobacteria bacterium]
MPSYLPSLAEIADWARLRELRGDFLFRPNGIRVDLWEGGKKTIPSPGDAISPDHNIKIPSRPRDFSITSSKRVVKKIKIGFIRISLGIRV